MEHVLTQSRRRITTEHSLQYLMLVIDFSSKVETLRRGRLIREHGVRALVLTLSFNFSKDCGVPRIKTQLSTNTNRSE